MKFSLLFAVGLAFATPLAAEDAPLIEDAPAQAKATTEAKETSTSPWKSGVRFDVDLDDKNTAHFRFFGSHRTRFQERTPTSYAPGATNRASSFDTFMRTRLGLEAKISPWANGLIEIQDVRKFGEEAYGASDTSNGIDLLQGYFYSEFDWFGFDTTMKVGRQRLTIGNQRLFSTLEFAPSGRAWDGVSFDGMSDNWHVRKFWLMLDEGARANDDSHMLGLTFQTWLGEKKAIDLEFAFLYDIQGGTATDRRVLTASVRENGKFGDFDYTAELIGQFGRQENGTPSDDDVSAYAFALTAGYTIPIESIGGLRLGLEYDHASGDSDPTDDKLKTFRSPFPFGHKYQGIADVVGWRNLSDFSFQSSFSVEGSEGSYEKLTFAVQVHHFRRVESEDGVYNPGNGLIRAGSTAASDTIGNEIDFQVNMQVNKWLMVEAAWGHFIAGKFFEDTKNPAIPTDGANEDGDTDFFWLSATFSF